MLPDIAAAMLYLVAFIGAFSAGVVADDVREDTGFVLTVSFLVFAVFVAVAHNL